MSALARCVPDPGRFLVEDWGIRFVLAPGADPISYADLLSIDAVDEIVTSTGLRAPAFRLVKGGETLPPSAYLRSARVGSRPVHDLVDPGRVYAQFAAGATIVLQGLHRYWPPLAAFCRDLELTLGHPTQANAYVTPPTASGLRVHADGHDVFALQASGRKHWVVYGDGDDPAMDVDLHPGDALYLPEGTRHAAGTVDEPSVHVTIGVRTTTWAEVLRRATGRVLDDAAFSERLPVAYHDDRPAFAAAVAGRLRDLAARIEKLDGEEVAEQARRAFLGGRAPLLRGALGDLLAAGTVTDDTAVRRRPGTVCDVTVSGGRTVVTLGDRTMHMPEAAAPAMRRVAAVPAGGTLRAGDLAGALDRAGRVVLVRRLVLEGLLTLTRDAG